MEHLEEKRGKVVGLAISEKRGTRKSSVDKVLFIENEGIEGDGHKNYKRQVSVLSKEERDRIAKRALIPGDAAENVLIEGIDELSKIPVGTRINIGNDVVLEIIQIGKECADSPIHEYTGAPVLPNVGLFCKVIKGGWVKINDEVIIV